VRLTFDPTRVTYEELLDAFWRMHDPTQMNRQGPDVGSQYRSVIFVHNPRQEATARASRSALDTGGILSRPVVTEISPAGRFWPAEDYHQQYLAKRGVGSCHVPG
jgi:peptide-methionine (S)-S-oxide reductase